MATKDGPPAGDRCSQGPEEPLSFSRAIERAQGRFVFHVDPQYLMVYIGCEAIKEELTRSDLLDIIREAAITAPVEEGVLLDLLLRARDERKIPLSLLAHGNPPLPGRDGEIRFFKQPVQAKVFKPIEGAEQAIDYREMHSFDNIASGDLIAEMLPKEEGSPGLDVFGTVVKPPRVEDKLYLAGQNVRLDAATHRFYATHHGLCRIVENKVTVDPVYAIQHSVDLTVGNIRFLGRVEVGQDVLEGFTVSAEEGIDIRGTAEACTLSSKGSITVGGGVKGKGKGRIECGGHLSARFLDEVSVVCEGDVYVKNEIMNCEIHSHGRVILENGAVVGGRVIALKGIHIMDAGSEIGTLTTLIAGLDYELVDRLLKMGPRLSLLADRRERVFKGLGADLERELKASVHEEKRLLSLRERMEEAKTVQVEYQALEEESGSLVSPYENLGKSEIVITNSLYSGVSVVVGSAQRTGREALKGPLTLEENELTGVVEIRNSEAWERPRAPSPGTPAPLSPVKNLKRALLLDDDPALLEILEDILSGLGYECLMAASAQDASVYLDRKEPLSVIISDIKMPGENGIAFVSRALKMKGYENIPLIIISGHFTAEQLLKVEASFRKCVTLTKPFGVKQMREALVKVVSVGALPKMGFDCAVDAAESQLVMTLVAESEAMVSTRRRLFHCIRIDRRISALRQDLVAEAFVALGKAKEPGAVFRIPVGLEKNAEGESGPLSIRGDLYTWETLQGLFERLIPSQVDGGGRKVLVADDMMVMRKMIARELEKRNFVVSEAKDGQAALDCLCRESPACCLLDVNMPKKSGLDVLAAMRKDARLKEIPVVLCTGLKDKAVLLAAIKLGVSSILMKPFTPEDLIAKVQDACSAAP